MTIEEAIDRIRDMIFPMPSAEKDNIEALRMALEALKELPKRRKEAKRWKTKALKAEPKHGHWIERAKCEYRCDQCGKIVFADDENELNYCCSCGAKMKRRDL